MYMREGDVSYAGDATGIGGVLGASIRLSLGFSGNHLGPSDS